MDEALTITEIMARQNYTTDIINSYSKRLLGFIRKRVDSDADAEDILQDVFFQFIGNTEPVEQVTSWLFTVARNKIIDRKRKRKPLSLEEQFAGDEDDLHFDWTDTLPDPSGNPEMDYIRQLFWDELNDALDELPAAQRDVFIWHELDGESFREIAERTGEGMNTLLSRKRYAVLHLRNRLQVLRDELLNY